MKIQNILVTITLGVLLVACRTGDIDNSEHDRPHEHQHSSDDQADHTDRGANKKTSVTINSKCPVMGGDVDPGAGTVIYKGHTIGFGCDPCIKDWHEFSDAEKDAFVTRTLSRKR